MKKILIDGRFVGVGDSITRYTLEILKRLLSMDQVNQYTLLIRPAGEKLAKNLKLITSDLGEGLGRDGNSHNLKLKTLDIPHYSISEQTKLLKYLNEQKFDLVHFVQFNHPIRYRGKFVVTIHDLTLLGHLHRMNFGKKAGFKIAMRSAIKNSAKIFTISKTSKNDIVEYYKIDPDKVVVTHLAVDSKYNQQITNHLSTSLEAGKSQITKFKEKYGICGDYILYTGMWQRHKNLLRMLKAFEQVISQTLNLKSQTCNSKHKNCHCEESATRQSIQLVLVGKIDKDEPEILQEIERINKSNKANEANQANSANVAIVTTGFIDEEELPIAYAGALAYCIPSLSEGFGLPPLEAMACGTPVISSNISAMPEILGDAPLYFDPYDVDDIAAAMKKIIEDKNLRDQLSKKGIERAKKYNWQDTAKETLKVYKQSLETK
jgi:glycosyltransferase involved in cell wall biosynthesis